MKLLLLQDAVYLPTFGGGNKANRLLLESLAARGHSCRVIAPALTTRAGPTTPEEFLAQMAERGVEVLEASPTAYRLRHRGVEVEALLPTDLAAHGDLIRRRTAEIRPDHLLVSDDKRHFLLASALDADPEGVVLLVHTLLHLPFGPMATEASAEQTALLRRVPRIIAVSRYVQSFLRAAGLESSVLPFPVYGPGPFPNLGSPDRGFVTLINPCAEKGLAIFLELARCFPDLPFAAVPTWGAGAEELALLAAVPNVRVLPPADDIGEILVQTRVLLVPSLIPETFGYVATEALLRGIPVLAADIGGLPEAMLGVGCLLPVRPAERRDGGWVSPPQDVTPWSQTLGELLADPEVYAVRSLASREAAGRFAAGADAAAFEAFLAGGTL
jgi:glycosyltransferase involved in cell wall biosynthesis